MTFGFNLVIPFRENPLSQDLHFSLPAQVKVVSLIASTTAVQSKLA